MVTWELQGDLIAKQPGDSSSSSSHSDFSEEWLNQSLENNNERILHFSSR